MEIKHSKNKQTNKQNKTQQNKNKGVDKKQKEKRKLFYQFQERTWKL